MAVSGLAEAARWRRALQLCLASLWLLDGVLQVQVFMFSHGFARMVGAAARGNPAVIAGPVTWAGRLIGEHGALATSAIAAVEILLGLGIAWRPTVRLALAASIAWALGVWWLGEGLGGLLLAGASPVTGAPGAVILYAALAVVLWPAGPVRPGRAAGQEAAGMAPGGTGPGATGTGRAAAGGAAARMLWLVLWGGLSLLCLRVAVWSPGALRGSIMAVAGGQPQWLAPADATAGTVLAHHGALASFMLAGLLAVIASGVFWPPRARRVILGIAAVLAVVLWAAGQNFGGLFSGMATDPSSGPLLLLLALAYWPLPAADEAGQVRAARAEAGAGSLAGLLVRRDIDVMNVAMALAMVSMLAGRPSPLDRVWVLTFAAAAAWFAGHAISAWRRRAVPRQHVMHLLSCGGMLVMLIAPRAGAGPMGSMSPGGQTGDAAVIMPALAAAFAVAMAASVVMITDRLTAPAWVRAWPMVASAPRLAAGTSAPLPAGTAAARTAAGGGPAITGAAVSGPGRERMSGPVCPRLRVSCQVAMGLAMACMLIQML
ncbi:MAG TPA: DUF5134 domain-containing protein [Streptosporangiaceae bacterium]|nr:DUF5134 domain-containing protein [Streptosporangiaceae bacterium]